MNKKYERRLPFLFFDRNPEEIAEDLSWAKDFSANALADELRYAGSVLNKVLDIAKEHFSDDQDMINKVVDQFFEDEEPDGVITMIIHFMKKKISKEGCSYFREFAAKRLLDEASKSTNEREKLINEIYINSFFAHLAICEITDEFDSADLNGMPYLNIFCMGLVCGRGLEFLQGRNDIFHKGYLDKYNRLAQSWSKTKDHAKKIPLYKEACDVADKLWIAGSHKNHIEMTAFVIEGCKQFKKLPKGTLQKEICMVARNHKMAKGEKGFKKLENNDKEIRVDSLLRELCTKI
ncbi:hypothetical protein [Solidesulfovibrio magneticus]|uniref:Uncharacterized protein n=1 Tax=Solidesulfovibrio magneticus (strain ATCC 700980 / DSM 13731 / RS-1) TaxID=573370 RepID=C4XM54_SOLM1|nr:hypothetical protein [Solidesulfovibrio magneticus]BAH77182.1 hypothetical protein DMR_36910 [Solidesulfovibrio magneticus RS-1]